MSDDSEPDPVGSEELFDGEEPDEGSRGEVGIADALCSWLISILVLFVLSSMLLVFGVASLFATTPGSANNVVSVLNVVGAGAFSLGSLAVIGFCTVKT